MFMFLITCEKNCKQKQAKRNDYLLPQKYKHSRFWEYFAMQKSIITIISNLIFLMYVSVSQLKYQWTLFRV